MTITCGFCNESTGNITEHFCEDMTDFDFVLDSYRTSGSGFQYSASSLASAESFLKAHPEFVEQSVKADVMHFTKVAKGLSVETRVDVTPEHFESLTGFPLTEDFDLTELDREAEWDGIYANQEFDTVLQGVAPWRDVEPTRCTTAYHWWTGKVVNNTVSRSEVNLMPENYLPTITGKSGRIQMTSEEVYVQSYEALDFEKPQLMRYEFAELQGFTSQLLIDADITEKFQYKVFNAFVGRDNKFHIGLLTFERTGDDQIAVTCKRNGCFYRNTPFFSPENASRTQQEDFITACIRHGNNHGPDFIVKRSDFTFIHAQNCDTFHDTKVEGCNGKEERLDVNALDPRDLDAVYGYLIHHRKFCSTRTCRCGHYYHMLSALLTNDYERQAA